MKSYPDVTELLRQKSERRKRQARLTFEEKIAIVNKWGGLTRRIGRGETVPRTSSSSPTERRSDKE